MRLSIVVLLLSVLLSRSTQAADSGGLTTNANGQVTLTWTASGDDGSTGRATQYDLRYSLSTITSTNFVSSTAATR